MTKDEAVKVEHGTILSHTFLVGYDGNPLKYQVIGNCKMFKGMPEKFSLSVKALNKYTLKFGGTPPILQINENNQNQWKIS